MKLKDKNIYPAWEIQVINNKVVFQDRLAFDKHLIPLEGRENLQLVIKRKVKNRSRKEEKFYYAVPVQMVAEEMQITKQEAHDFLRKLFLSSEESTPNGFRYTRVLSTTELGDKAYREYWEDVIRWAALPTQDQGLSQDSGLQLYIPYPNEADWDGRDEYFMHS